eukprot:3301741-Pyramimonas_sp.AAC.1
MGPRSAVLGGGDACVHRHCGLRWGSLWGHGTCEGCDDMGGGDDDGDDDGEDVDEDDAADDDADG